jgi:hypothetical protein
MGGDGDSERSAWCGKGEPEAMAERAAGRRAAGEEEIEVARATLRAIVATLRGVRDRLAALHASIPPSPEEIADVDMPDELDVLTEIRMVAVIVLDDRVDPLIQTLIAAAEYRQPTRS